MTAMGEAATGAARDGLGPGGKSSTPVRTTYLVKQLELAIRKKIDASIRGYGLTTPQYTALSVLDRHPGLSSAALARRSFVTPQAANEMVAALERKGLVERHADAHNHRVLEMFLTEAGRRTLEVCSTAVFELEQRMMGRLAFDEAAQFRALLEICLAAVVDQPTMRGLPAPSAP
jgi:DNA-binding MarR family transcriptional regulator